ncbi:hypothetical protein K438DRAFT_1966992 [Mycena galopus ATCC 62051]|nr:hypothetical protein K438DRAFT_1966992 [Mycena galopus ATCC 62051]
MEHSGRTFRSKGAHSSRKCTVSAPTGHSQELCTYCTALLINNPIPTPCGPWTTTSPPDTVDPSVQNLEAQLEKLRKELTLMKLQEQVERAEEQLQFQKAGVEKSRRAREKGKAREETKPGEEARAEEAAEAAAYLCAREKLELNEAKVEAELRAGVAPL